MRKHGRTTSWIVSMVLLGAALAGWRVRATWFGENVEPGADIMMMDLRYPWWAESTYNACWNFYFKAPGNFSGYGGFTMGVDSVPPDHLPNFDPDVQAAFRPSSVWSFWGSNAAGEPVRVVATSRYNYPKQYIGEGASGALGGPSWPMITSKRWYTMLMRIWQPLGERASEVAYVGRWVKDVEARHWYLYGIVRLPTPATSFTGNAGFLEDFAFGGRSVRSLHRRLGYYRKDGVWKKSDTVTYNVPLRGTYWVVQKLENGRVLAMELSGNRALLPLKLQGRVLEPGKKHAFTVDQPDKPVLDRPAVEQVRAISNGRQQLVSWVIPPSAAPQLSYKVEIFDNPRCFGKPVAIREERLPTTRTVLLDAAVDHPTVRLSIIDIFDQAATPVVVAASPAPAAAAPPPVKSDPGMHYEFRVKDEERHENVLYPVCDKAPLNRNEKHYWTSLKEVRTGRLVQEGITRGFNTTLRGDRNRGYAFTFRGLLRVPRDGLYLFHVRATDGIRIDMDGKTALIWDGLHGPAEKTFSLPLGAGDHPLSLVNFLDRQQAFLSVEWEGPNMPRRPIPLSNLRHRRVSGIPVASVRAEVHPAGMVSITGSVESAGRSIERIQVFLDTMLLAEAASASLTASELLPSGKHALWSRAWYDGNHTVDSEPLIVTVASATIRGWRVTNAGEEQAPHNLRQTGPDAFEFVGEGEQVIFRNIEGNFTLTCRIDRCLGLRGEPVSDSAWVGLTVREHAEEKIHKRGREFGLFQTAKHGLRTTPDWSDGGGSGLSVQVLPKGYPWLRIVRRGKLWTAWVSRDGRSWQCMARHVRPFADKVGAGVVFRALPGEAQRFFQATVSHLSLVGGLPEGFALPDATPARGLETVDVTGVVVARSDPNTILVRTPDRGILRSTDGGDTWAFANGNLSGAANAVRSVAIDPTDPAVIYRAAGLPGNKNGSGLYVTKNGGSTWERLDFPGDFDGAGPSAFGGEIIAIHPRKPDILLVGCETRGLFQSEDGGATWKQVAPAGQRFTVVKFHPTDLRKNGDAIAHAMTCPDALMELLGRGRVRSTTPLTSARDYVSYDSGKTMRLQNERDDLGFLNLAYGDPQHGTFEIATTHGLLHSFSAGWDSYLFSTSVALESYRPFTAIAAGKIKDQTWFRIYAQALNPAVSGRLSVCNYARDIRWSWTTFKGMPKKGVIAITPGDARTVSSGRYWWILCTDGLYRLDHRTATMTKIGLP